MTPEIKKMHEPWRLVSAAAAALITAAVLTTLARPAHAAPPGATRTAVATQAAPGALVERGRYLIRTTGCNDCHTLGYAESGGTLPEEAWLTGMAVGFQGPWGTSYPANLRLTVQSMTQSQWVSFARAQRLPPMPWFALRDMSDDDLRAIYQFIRSLGAKGQRMPAPAAPGTPVATPYIDMTPKNLPAQAAAAATASNPRS